MCGLLSALILQIYFFVTSDPELILEDFKEDIMKEIGNERRNFSFKGIKGF
jgi:predicted DNA-binding transcriptional regulator